MANISFKVNKAEAETIHKIVMRAEKMAKRLKIKFDRMETSMDLTACHANGCPLDLDQLNGADDGTFGHDVFGISRHIDRKTGQLGGCFLPRTAKPQPSGTRAVIAGLPVRQNGPTLAELIGDGEDDQ